MSWLNNSLNTIKGQLTNLAQEVLADTAGPGDDEYRGDEVNTKTALELLTETQLQKVQLDKACEDKDREIAALRKQITTLKNRKISDDEGNVDTGASARHNERIKSSDAGEEQNVEDSWCWEPTSSEEATPTAKAGDMVDVSLSSSSGSNISRNAAADVGKLNAKIEQLEEQNGELRNSLEELDAQHDQAMQDVLAHKAQLVTQLTELKASQADRLVAHELAVARLQKQLQEEQQRRAEVAAAHQELQQRVEAQSKELQQGVLELADMQQLLEKRGADNAELIERVRQAEAERQKLQQQLDELAKQQVKEKKTSESSNSSLTGKHSEDEFIVVRNADAAGSSSDPDPDADAEATVPPTKEKLRDKLVSLEARIAELSAANAKLQDGELERQLASSVLDEQLAELETRLRISESEKEQLQLELQRKLQQLTLQNQELKLSAEADQETHANDLEQQLGALRDENRKLRQELDASIAQAKFRQAIAEEKQEITDLDLDIVDTELDEPATTTGRKDPHKLRPLLEALLAENTDQALERTHRLLNERWQRLETVEQRMVELQDQQLIAEHDKKTLEADISQYILQCDELMKNNELLLNELDKFKRNKLETIEEHHEETIAQLEQQLEEAQAQVQRQQQQLQQQQQQQYQQEQQQQQQHDESLAVESNREQLQQVEQLLAQQTDKLQQTRAHAEDLQTQLEQLKVKLSEAQAESSQVQPLRQQLQQLQAAKELEKDAQLKELQEVQAQLLVAENQLRESTQSDNELKEQLEQQLAKKQQQEELLREVQEELKQQQAQNELLQSEAQTMRAQLQQVQLELEQCSQEKQQQIEQLQAQKEGPDQQQQLEQLEQLKAELQQSLEKLNNEKQELIKALQQKHAENTQYYAEIQRLQPLEQQLSEMRKEREKLCDQINFLKEKSDILTSNLLTEQNNQRKLQQQQLEAQEKQLSVQRDLERLRAHLVEIEEMHTQETLELQRELEESRSKQSALQQEVSKSSTAYTSASIRANQQAETLQAQHALLLQQRDELLAKLGQCEDRELKQQAALTNLQCALEQFQNDKEHDIELGMQRMRRELQQQLERETALRNDVAALQQQLSDANQGLRAAARLSDQLEAGQQTIAVLREEVDHLKDANFKLEQRLSSSESSQTDKIDKSLIKSLLIGYVVSGHAGDKQQVLRMISSLLDFNAQEADKVGLNKPQNSWLGSILGSASNAVSAPGTGNDNLLQAFVQFLEQESQPQPNTQTRPTLLSMGKQLEGSPTSSVSTTSATDARAGGAAAAASVGAGGAVAPAAVSKVSGAAVGGGEQAGARGTTGATPPTPPMQSLLMSSNEFAPARNSSSILKDILSDS